MHGQKVLNPHIAYCFSAYLTKELVSEPSGVKGAWKVHTEMQAGWEFSCATNTHLDPFNIHSPPTLHMTRVDLHLKTLLISHCIQPRSTMPENKKCDFQIGGK